MVHVHRHLPVFLFYLTDTVTYPDIIDTVAVIGAVVLGLCMVMLFGFGMWLNFFAYLWFARPQQKVVQTTGNNGPPGLGKCWTIPSVGAGGNLWAFIFQNPRDSWLRFQYLGFYPQAFLAIDSLQGEHRNVEGALTFLYPYENLYFVILKLGTALVLQKFPFFSSSTLSLKEGCRGYPGLMALPSHS